MNTSVNHLASVARMLGFGYITLASFTCRLYAQSALTVGNVQSYPGVNVPVPVLASSVSNVTAAQFEVASTAPERLRVDGCDLSATEKHYE